MTDLLANYSRKMISREFFDVFPKSFLKNNRPFVPVVPVEKRVNLSEIFYPERLIIKSILVDSPILNPVESDQNSLEEALLSGVVRHPDSVLLGQSGNLVLFGHSSYFPIVNNLAFKSLNHLEKLMIGDEILVISDNREYLYIVKKIELADSNWSFIDLKTGERTLTIFTCDALGEKNSRFVAEAYFVGEKEMVTSGY